MESLCHSMSDQKGERDTNIWAALGRYENDLSRFFSMIDRGRKRQIAEMFRLGPEQRLIENLKGVERKARSTVQPREVLVFGHTHRPFVNKAENLANTGSWVTDCAYPQYICADRRWQTQAIRVQRSRDNGKSRHLTITSIFLRLRVCALPCSDIMY